MFAEILLPQKVGNDKSTLTYRVPPSLSPSLQTGSIVEVPLRNRKIRGVIASLHDHEPSYKTKEILEISEKAPHLKPWQVELMFWIADYYFCPVYKVLNLFFPKTITKKKKLYTWVPEDATIQPDSQKLTLTPEQEQAIKQIITSEDKAFLLHGVTGSGKTEIYRRMAEKVLEKGQQALLLVPEIMLTPQTFHNFQEEFGNTIALLHSQLSTKEKEKYWYKIYHGEAKIIIGSRSALFAPFQNLGIIMIDEEHETSYKQDQAPRYHTRDVAKKMAELLGIKLVLGSATPSLESYYQAQQGKYKLLELKTRIKYNEETELPSIKVIDLRDEFRKANHSIFSELLNKKIDQKLKAREQVILFLNRRGSASAVICRECGYTERCENCDIAMRYHKKLSAENYILPAERLICHYCGKIKKVPTTCPSCQSVAIRYIGLGTQRVEEDIQKIYPLARTVRADRDVIQKKEDYLHIYNALKNHEADILIGTQMIGKGLHFPKVSLVGVMLADLSLIIPDFRSAERTFQLLTQVAGRAGRADKKGEVIIQTYLPDHYAIRKVLENDYQGFAREELEIRQKFNYPPYTKLIKITVSGINPTKTFEKTKKLFELLQAKQKEHPEEIMAMSYFPALIAKLQKKYRWHILINGSNPSIILQKTSEDLRKTLDDLGIRIDVDPISTL